jgi:hypothetical protein
MNKKEKSTREIMNDRDTNAATLLFIIFLVGAAAIVKFVPSPISFFGVLLWIAALVIFCLIHDRMEELKAERHRLIKALYEAQKPWWEERNKLILDKKDEEVP